MKNTKKMTLLLLLGAMAAYGASAQNVVRANPNTAKSIPSTQAGSATGGFTYKWKKNGVVDATLGTAATTTIPAAAAQGWATMERVTVSTECGDEVPSNDYTVVFANSAAPTAVTIAGVKWAPVNLEIVGGWAVRPDQYTGFFQWNRLKPYSPTYPANGVAIPDWEASIVDAAWTTSPCPSGWHLPDTAEFGKLDRAGGQYTGGRGGWWAAANSTAGNKVAGRFFGTGCGTNGAATVTATINATTGEVTPSTCIFLPAGGWRQNSNGAVGYSGSRGHYWSSLQSSATNGYYLGITTTATTPASGYTKASCFAIRCVQN